MGYIGNEPTTGHFPVDNLVGAPAGTYPLTQAPATAGAIEVSVGGVLQPTTAYSVSGTTLTMAGVATGVPIFIRHLGETLSIPTPGDGTITDVKIADVAATKLTGTIAGARFPSTYPAGDGSALTNITHIPANDSVGLNQLAPSVDGNIISFDTAGDPAYVATGTAGQVLTSGGAGTAPTFADAGGGSLLVDVWRLHTAATISGAGNITANLERADTLAPGFLGSGMTESSGVFTFPEIGIWKVEYGFYVKINTSGGHDCAAYIDATTNNSWSGNDRVAEAPASFYCPSASWVRQSSYSSFTFDVTNVSTHKVRFAYYAENSVTMDGSTNRHRTYFIFTKLGDT